LRIEGLVGVQQRELLVFDLRLVNSHIAVVLECKQNSIPQAETQLAIGDVVAQVLWSRQFVQTHLLGQQAMVSLTILCSRGQNRKG
jgi:hypothetical protein